MRKLFFLGFLSLLLAFNITTLARAEVNNPAEYSQEGGSSQDPQLDDDSADGLSPEENLSSSDVSGDEILAVNCQTFVTAENIVNLKEEDLYKKQSLFIGNLEFARHSQFRLDPKDTSLQEINNSFLQSDFAKERLDTLSEMEKDYSLGVKDCLVEKAKASFEKESVIINETRDSLLAEEEASFDSKIKNIENKKMRLLTQIDKKSQKDIQKAKLENAAAKKSFQRQVNQAYEAVYSGQTSSIYNSTIVSFENKIKKLPQALSKRNSSIEKNKRNAYRKASKQTESEKEKTTKIYQEKINKIKASAKEEITEKEKIKETSLEDAEAESQSIASEVYSKRKESVAEEDRALQDRKQYAEDLLTHLNYLWQEDREKKLLKLDTESIDLDAESITAQGVPDPLPANPPSAPTVERVENPEADSKRISKTSKKTIKKIKSSTSGKSSKKGLNTSLKQKENKDKDGSGDFSGNIDRIYKEHNSANGDWGGETLPSYVVAALAEAAGMPGVTMEQVTRGESGAHKKNSARPGATGVDPGGTKGYGLWMITTSFNDKLAKKVGGYEKFLNPVLNAWAASQIYKSNGLGAWYGTRSVAGDGINYKGKYDLRKALGGKTYKQVLASYGIKK